MYLPSVFNLLQSVVLAKADEETLTPDRYAACWRREDPADPLKGTCRGPQTILITAALKARLF